MVYYWIYKNKEIRMNFRIVRHLFWNSTFFILLVSSLNIVAQDPLRFEDDINRLLAQDNEVDRSNDLIVFTGSSSVRFWLTLQNSFPNYNIINRGFGGSHMSDLLFYCDKLILQYQPKKVFIYEGDNDISAGEERTEILKEAQQLVDKIKANSPHTVIYFIGAKPSVERWNLKSKYEQFNYALSLWALLEDGVTFIDIWSPMVTADDTISPDLFVEDMLHMNAKGYEIWKKVIQPFIEE